MSFAGAIAQLAAWSIPGITNLGTAWDTPPTGSALPALLIDMGSLENSLNERGAGPAEATFSGSDGAITLVVRHALLVCTSSGLYKAQRQTLPALLDAYATVLRANWMLADTISEPLLISSINTGILRVAGMPYFGANISLRLRCTS